MHRADFPGSKAEKMPSRVRRGIAEASNSNTLKAQVQGSYSSKKKQAFNQLDPIPMAVFFYQITFRDPTKNNIPDRRFGIVF